MQKGRELKIHWSRVFLHCRSWWLKMRAKQAKIVPTSPMNASDSFALQGNKWFLSTLSPFRPRRKDVSYHLFWSNFYLEHKSRPLKGLHVHLGTEVGGGGIAV